MGFAANVGQSSTLSETVAQVGAICAGLWIGVYGVQCLYEIGAERECLQGLRLVQGRYVSYLGRYGKRPPSTTALFAAGDASPHCPIESRKGSRPPEFLLIGPSAANNSPRKPLADLVVLTCMNHARSRRSLANPVVTLTASGDAYSIPISALFLGQPGLSFTGEKEWQLDSKLFSRYRMDSGKADQGQASE